MKISTIINPFDGYASSLPAEEALVLKDFFADFDCHCDLPWREKKKLREDFERAIMYYASKGMNLEHSLELLDTRNLGGFYARPPVLWFPLDDAAKIYPLSMMRGADVRVPAVRIFKGAGSA